MFLVPRPALFRQSTFTVFDEMEVKVKSKRKDKNPLLCIEMSNVMRLLWSGKWSVFTPAGFVFAVWKFMPFFRCYQQQDAQELFTSLMDAMSDELVHGGVSAAGVTSTNLGPVDATIVPLFPPLPSSQPWSPTTTDSPQLDVSPTIVAAIKRKPGRPTLDRTPAGKGNSGGEKAAVKGGSNPRGDDSDSDDGSDDASDSSDDKRCGKKRGRSVCASRVASPARRAAPATTKRTKTSSDPLETPSGHNSFLPRFKPSRFIHDTVFGETQTTVTCQTCGFVS